MLAWRVKTLTDALMMAQRGAETNFRSITEFLAGQQTELPMIGFQEHAERSQKLGVGLLVLGFVLVGSSGLLNAYLLWAGSRATFIALELRSQGRATIGADIPIKTDHVSDPLPRS